MTLVEIMFAAAIGLIILGVAISVFVNQQSLLKNQNDNANIRAKGRLAIKILAKQIRMAGYGLPPNLGIQSPLSTNSISFQSNLYDVTTALDPTGTGILSTDTSLDVVDSSSFTFGDNIVIYHPDFNIVNINSVQSIATGLINLSSAVGEAYTFGVNTKLITVNKYNDITIALSGTKIQKTIDGKTVMLINDVDASTGLVFDFSGATQPSMVRKIGITINLVDPNNTHAVIEFKTDVSLRNS